MLTITEVGTPSAGGDQEMIGWRPTPICGWNRFRPFTCGALTGPSAGAMGAEDIGSLPAPDPPPACGARPGPAAGKFLEKKASLDPRPSGRLPSTSPAR